MNEKLKQLVCLKIKDIRERNKLSQEAFVDKVNIDITTISNIENFKTFPSSLTICKIMTAFNLEPNQFFDFIKYNKNESDLIDALIIEHLRNTPKEIKSKILELLEIISQNN